VRILVELTSRISNNDSINVRILQEKNRKLSEAYLELQQAQALLVEKEKLEHELNLARQIQEASLPKALPPIPGWSLDAFWQPARKVGGDLYDVQPQPDGSLKFLIADVTGKGVPAALIMATTRSILRALMTQVDDTCQVLRAANDLLVDETPWNMFVTCFYGVLDPASGRLRFANAGQNLPYRLTANGPQTLYATGMPLGLFPGSNYVEGEAVIQPREAVLLYSDGLVEIHNPMREMFGNPRLEALLASLPPGAAMIRPLLETVFAYAGPNWEQEDDITLLTLTRHSL
jgi:serine phosphatase RsbU (regulator of sigma subunit)